jgi:hypothetical protein
VPDRDMDTSLTHPATRHPAISFGLTPPFLTL